MNWMLATLLFIGLAFAWEPKKTINATDFF